MKKLTEFNNLPPEILLNITNFMTPETMVKASSVNRFFKNIFNDNFYWYKKFNRHFTEAGKVLLALVNNPEELEDKFYNAKYYKGLHFGYREKDKLGNIGKFVYLPAIEEALAKKEINWHKCFVAKYNFDYKSKSQGQLFSLIKEELFESLKQRQISCNDLDSTDRNETLLSVIRRGSQSLKDFIFQEVILKPDNLEDPRLFHFALYLNQPQSRFENLLLLNLNINYADKKSFLFKLTPLELAIKLDRLDIMMYLLKNTADIQLGFPLLQAVEKSDLNIIEILIKNGSELKTADHDSLLNTAISKGDVNIAKFLLANGAELTASNFKKLLHSAVSHCGIDMVEFLFNKRATIYPPYNKKILTQALSIALESNNNDRLDIAKLLLSQGARADGDKGKTLIITAAKYGYVDLIEPLIQNGANLNDVNATESPLFIAVRSKNNHMVRKLLAHGADVNAKNKCGDIKGVTALHLAVDLGDLAMVKTLIEHGANVMAKIYSNDATITPLSISKERGNAEIINELNEHVNESRCSLS